MPKIERRNSALGASSTVPDNEARNRKNGKLPIRLNTIPLRATMGYGNGKAEGRTSPRSPYQLKSMEPYPIRLILIPPEKHYLRKKEEHSNREVTQQQELLQSIGEGKKRKKRKKK